MSIKALSDRVSVCPQIRPEDLDAVSQLGFRSVICNRPDGETADQSTFADMKAAAHKLGLEIRYLPVVAGRIEDQDAQLFGELLETLPSPILAYCRSGTRSATLWSLSQVDTLPLDEIIARTRSVGFDLTDALGQVSNRTAGH